MRPKHINNYKSTPYTVPLHNSLIGTDLTFYVVKRLYIQWLIEPGIVLRYFPNV